MESKEPQLDAVRDRLSRLLSEWGGEVSSLLFELGQKRGRLVELEAAASEQAGELEAMRSRVQDHEELIASLRQTSQEASTLKSEARQKDLDIERLAGELKTEQEIGQALRKQAERADDLASALQIKEREVQQGRDERAQLAARIEDLNGKLNDLEADCERRGDSESAELVAVRGELEQMRDHLDVTRGELDATRAELDATRAEVEARKALIKSLRADADKAAVLESMLEEKSQIIRQLEQSADRNEPTIAQPRGRVDESHADPDGEDTTIAARVDPPAAFSEAELAEIQDADETTAPGDAEDVDTISIDVRKTLEEVRNRVKPD